MASLCTGVNVSLLCHAKRSLAMPDLARHCAYCTAILSSRDSQALHEELFYLADELQDKAREHDSVLLLGEMAA